MGTPNGTVLIVEEDPFLRRTLNQVLSDLKFNIGLAGTGEAALTRLRMVDYELVLLDINMRDNDGIETCRRIRRSFTRLPVFILTAREGLDDRIEALDAGADDYITIPFQIRELAARIRSGIRRFRAPGAPIEESLQVGEISLDPGRRIVKKADTRVYLTPMEFSALQLLMENAGKPLTYVRLISSLWGPEFAEHPEKLRVLMNEIRKKIETNTANPRYLLTELRVGYRFAGN